MNHLIHFIFTWIPIMCSTLYQILWIKENKRQGSVSDGAYSAVGGMSHIQRNGVGVAQLFKFICGSSSPKVFSSSLAKFYSFCLLSISCFYPLISIPIASISANFLISYCPGFCKIPESGNDHFIHHFFWFIVFQRYNFPNFSQNNNLDLLLYSTPNHWKPPTVKPNNLFTLYWTMRIFLA